jgi:ketosteroid isomerase-like protein
MTASGSTDIEAVRAASRSFYAALLVLDDGTRMEAVWANKPYVTYVGPSSTTVIVGWEEQKRYWKIFNSEFDARSVSIANAQIRVVGNLAWEVGLEVGHARIKDGTTRKIDWFVTNVFEKIEGRWLTVSHHAQPKPLAGADQSRALKGPLGPVSEE